MPAKAGIHDLPARPATSKSNIERQASASFFEKKEAKKLSFVAGVGAFSANHICTDNSPNQRANPGRPAAYCHSNPKLLCPP
jgi:hypothetical protein